MEKRKILKYIIGGCVVAIAIFLVVSSVDVMNKKGTANQPQQNQISEETILTLKDYPELFSKDVIIVFGENATEVERESVATIKNNLKELTGNEPIIKKDIELLESDKKTHNLILVGTPNTNSILQEVYKLTDATKVTNKYPGENKGILEILRNPWNSDRTLLLITASEECGVNVAITALINDKRIRKFNGRMVVASNFITITGRIVAIGNEPFTQLAVETSDSLYGLIGAKTKELRELQGAIVEIQGYIDGRSSPSFRTEKSINITEFKIVK